MLPAGLIEPIMRFRSTLRVAVGLLAGAASGPAQLITQYYAGTGDDLWVEVWLPGFGADLSTAGYHLGIWCDGASMDFLSGAAPTISLALAGTPDGTGTITFRRPGAAHPAVAAGLDLAGLAFDGNDSLVLYTGSMYSPGTVIDYIAFDGAGTEGAGICFHRDYILLDPGVPHTPAELAAHAAWLATLKDDPSTPNLGWIPLTLAEADDYTLNAPYDLRALGAGGIVLPSPGGGPAVPEPAHIALGGTALLLALVGWRRGRGRRGG